MIKNVHIHIFLFLLLLIPVSFAHAHAFNKNLKVGSTGQDVYELQKFLNSNQATQVAIEGPGSPGNETLYFGEKTKQAVILFQNLHAQEILVPNGLVSGTGFVGQSTRDFLNSVSPQSTPQTNVDSSTTTQTGTASNDSVGNPVTSNTDFGFIISPANAKHEQEVYIGSQHNISELQFSVGSHQVKSECFTDYTCKIRIPSDHALGVTKISSNDSRFGHQNVEVIASSERKPVLNVSKININKENLITGENFGNQMKIYTPYGIFNTTTVNNSFILEFPQSTVLATSTGFIYAENKSGLQSDILILPYEK